MNNLHNPPPLGSDSDNDVEVKVENKPIEGNGGSVVAIACEDFAIIGADTILQSTNNMIYTTEQRRLFEMTTKSVMGCTGCWCDVLGLSEQVKLQRQIYEIEHNREMSTEALARITSVVLYKRRFFPYQVYNILAGIDKNGQGAVYAYDPRGDIERFPYFASGDSKQLMLRVLENSIGSGKLSSSSDKTCSLTKEQAIAIVTECFSSTHTTTVAILNIITKDGIG